MASASSRPSSESSACELPNCRRSLCPDGGPELILLSTNLLRSPPLHGWEAEETGKVEVEGLDAFCSDMGNSQSKREFQIGRGGRREKIRKNRSPKSVARSCEWPRFWQKCSMNPVREIQCGDFERLGELRIGRRISTTATERTAEFSDAALNQLAPLAPSPASARNHRAAEPIPRLRQVPGRAAAQDRSTFSLV